MKDSKNIGMDYPEIFARLRTSRFRSSFRLGKKEQEYLREKGIDTIRTHAEEFIRQRLRVMQNGDGKQTPWKGHPVFVAQHATATCCRRCMEKWHGIPRNKVLADEDVAFAKELIMEWLQKHAP